MLQLKGLLFVIENAMNWPTVDFGTILDEVTVKTFRPLLLNTARVSVHIRQVHPRHTASETGGGIQACIILYLLSFIIVFVAHRLLSEAQMNVTYHKLQGGKMIGGFTRYTLPEPARIGRLFTHGE